MVRGLPRLSRAGPWQDIRLQHSPGEAAGAKALRARGARHVPQVACGAPNADLGGRPPFELPPFALRRLANLTHPVAVRLSPSIPLGSTSIAACFARFERTRHWTRQFQRSLQLSWKLAATCTRHRPSEAVIARERNLLQPSTHAITSGISQDHMWNLDETAVRMVPAGERVWTKRDE